MSRHAIVIKDVHKAFKEVKALNGVSLKAEKGKVFGLLGPNGAGKTTLIRVLTTLINADEGEVEIAGKDIQDKDSIRKAIGLAGQSAAVDENLTGRENIEMVGRLYHLSKQEAKKRTQNILERFSLTDAAERTAKTYSGGMRRRLDLAASLVGQPKILFLDEPTTGLDPRTRTEVWDMVRELVSDGTTVLLTTQYLEEADELADTIAIIDEGRVIAEGTAQELKQEYAKDLVEIGLENKEEMKKAKECLKKHYRKEGIKEEQRLRQLTIQTENGSQEMLTIVEILNSCSVSIKTINLKSPSLDDVFLSITGKQVSNTDTIG